MTALLIYFFISLFISFLCSLLESVILSVSHAHLAVLVKAGSKRGKLMSSLKEDINRPLSAILTINTIAHTLGAAGVGAQTYVVFGNEYVALSSIILTFCVLFFSEIIPKTLGANYTKSLVGFSAYTIRILIFIVFPMVFIGEKISKFLKRNDKDESKASREELIAMAELSEDEGAIIITENAPDVTEGTSNTNYKLNLKMPNLVWSGTKGCKKKNFKNPQWLRNIKTKN